MPRVSSGGGHIEHPAERARSKQAMSRALQRVSAKLAASCRNNPI
jgi:hypothetical protein